MDTVVQWATVVAAVGSAMVGGLMLAFGTSIMPGLRGLPAARAVAAMQAFNRSILNPVFGLVFGGTAVVSVLLAVTAPFADQPHPAWRVAGAVLYLVGPIGGTMLINVPLNNRLDAVDADSDAGARMWAEFLPSWTLWNHLRTVAAVLAATVLTAVA